MSLPAASYFASTGRLVANVLLLVGIVHAHVEMKPEHGGNHTMAVHGSDYPPTYFGTSNSRGLIYGHISLMVIGWVFVLPVGEYMFENALSLPAVVLPGTGTEGRDTSSHVLQSLLKFSVLILVQSLSRHALHRAFSGSSSGTVCLSCR